MKLNPALRQFWMTPARNRVLYGGRSSSKSHDAAGFAIHLATQVKTRFLCTRHFQSRISDSVYTLLINKIDEANLRDHFKILDSSIICKNTGTDFLFFGRARNIEEIKGTEDVGVHWAEECELMTQEQWNIIDPTLRGESSQHWLIFNPKFRTDYVYKRFVIDPPSDTIVRKINYTENPFLSSTMSRLIASSKEDDFELYRHIYLGEPLSDSDLILIKTTWIDAAIDAHIKLGFEASGRRVVGYDVADSGDDKCANVVAHGSVVYGAVEWQASEDELLKSCVRTYTTAVENGAQIVYDCIGVGAASGAKFDELNESQGRSVQHLGFNAGGVVVDPDAEYMPGKTNRDHFSNVKAQAWWLLADRFRNTYDAITNGREYPADQLISLSSDLPMLEKLKDELSTPRRDFDQNGRVKVESKKDLAKRGVSSPNLADALVMCYTPVESQSWSFF